MKALPMVVDCEEFVNRQAIWSGSVPLTNCHQLEAMCIPDMPGEVKADLHFGRTEQGFAVITGAVQVRLPVWCQRCLEPMVLELEAPVELHPVLPNRTAPWQEEKEVVVLDEAGKLSIIDLIEEECLLSCPIVPKHTDKECGVQFEQPAIKSDNETEMKRPNPFNILKGL